MIDAGEDAFGKGRLVASLDSPTKERVQTIILQKNILARFVTLALQNEGQELRFREVEIYNGPLLAIDECKKPNICPSDLKCVDGKKSPACVCPDGFRMIGSNKCEDANECEDPSRNRCGGTAVCVNTVGSYNCTCKQGHKFDENDLECKDINECENPLWNKCGDTTTCVNVPGSYKCSCREGYKLQISDLKYQCKDIDECATKDSCHVDASCYNTPGSYKCTCYRGLGGDGYKSCSRLPPCSNGQCNENAICKDFNGNYLCECRGGYYFNGKMCVEINECKLNKDICGSNSVCSNTWGSYRCNCEVGFESRNGDGKNCSEIDECEKREICGDSATCENTVGSYKCKCPDGFTFDTKTRTCADLDECTISQSCNPNMICTNTFGSYTCSCRQGYRSDKMQCAEIDECQEERYDCPKFSRCKNQNGGYECLCKEGYRKASDGTCSEICSPECENNSYCQDGKCLCKRGFSMGLDFTCKAAPAFVESSGVSLHTRVLFLMIAILWFLVLLWLMVLL
ncbi:fibulin-1-like [Stylophora pistillata]|uniref:fibulin-1-like n=1 Tax=Stylophora pistillata TaxID=50429 RepID=UPI000C03E360|nr:fibulin-1-like [Stylophora pistillata]